MLVGANLLLFRRGSSLSRLGRLFFFGVFLLVVFRIQPAALTFDFFAAKPFLFRFKFFLFGSKKGSGLYKLCRVLVNLLLERALFL